MDGFELNEYLHENKLVNDLAEKLTIAVRKKLIDGSLVRWWGSQVVKSKRKRKVKMDINGENHFCEYCKKPMANEGQLPVINQKMADLGFIGEHQVCQQCGRINLFAEGKKRMAKIREKAIKKGRLHILPMEKENEK